ncbi:helix-turn-helix domain-containing protein [Pseudomonas alcaligenes]|uniref:helix-turn-helix domain-containing protein n=1 Tax=Aquipseudomonas alcaligenes TaxID=43263 RepID=UPI002E7B1D2B|nr:helix-turn-helix domain-containing protein [Pseudomonas alcaligenes]MEE1951007.1 helix-turn-helix domain-containing protein [Pseudomonas alcaligenes]
MNKHQIPTDPLQRWEWIKFQLRIAGSSLAKVARSLKLSAQAVKNTKREPYPRVEREIAKVLHLKPIAIWPERWVSEDTPKRQRPSRPECTVQYHCTVVAKNSGCSSVSHRKTGVGA